MRSEIYSLKLQVVILTFLFHRFKLKKKIQPQNSKEKKENKKHNFTSSAENQLDATVMFSAIPLHVFAEAMFPLIPSSQQGCRRAVKHCGCSVEGRMSLSDFLVSSWEWSTAPG